MKSHLFLLLLLTGVIFTPCHLAAQKISFNLQGNKNEVKLLWLPIQWTSDLEGFVVQRKTESTSWKLLTPTPIYPGLQSGTLDNRTNDQSFLKNLEIVKDSMMASDKYDKISLDAFRQNVLMDPSTLQFLPFFVLENFETVLIYGFGYYDRLIPSAATYTYGLFPVKNGIIADNPIETQSWRYGDAPTKITVESSVEKKRLKSKQGMQLAWEIPKATLSQNNLKNYIVYKTDSLGVKKLLTPNPLLVNYEDPSKIIFIDNDYLFEERATFDIVILDIYDTERSNISIQITPEDFPDFPRPTLEISDDPNNANNIILDWFFPTEYTKFIKKVEIQRVTSDESNDVKVIEPTQNRYIENNITESGNYYYKIRLITTTGDVLISDLASIYKYFRELPEAPLNLKGTVVKKDNENYVVLTWDKSPNDKLTHHYQVFKSLIKNPEELAFISEFPNVTETKLEIRLPTSFGRVHRFAVRASSDGTLVSPFSDTIQIVAPSKSLPYIQIFPYNTDKNKITLEWEYPNYVYDLAGFRIYESGKLVADESILDAAKRKIVFENLEIGTYSYTIQAVSASGVLSALSSQSRIFKVEEKY